MILTLLTLNFCQKNAILNVISGFKQSSLACAYMLMFLSDRYGETGLNVFATNRKLSHKFSSSFILSFYSILLCYSRSKVIFCKNFYSLTYKGGISN